ncbi:excinuclease ABC subunit UvrA [Bythopirellula polymerisocia]|uniref:UvrABC system protein A n=1 Tax=Bythopirellula polymerisocia TaxID=2528003 RepID=A0A5C6D363_9BACT|nr:excinuclease ABC subunit UvrA [Bythopirellula polymerisocia]TWU29656.1 UvrABC system protein A [Bythopirellula polymerisocia]
MPASDIIIKGAREHNLRGVDLELPRNKLICLTGVSGSGKSSLAFDTLYAEGQRRYVESLSTFARQFLGQMPKPEVDHISGLSPSISIAQKSAGNNPRSTVGTITEIYDFLRVLYARVGQGHCPQCERPITAQSREEIIARIQTLPTKVGFMVLAPVVRGQKGEFRDLFEDLLKKGFVRARVDGQVVQLSDNLSLDRQMRHDIEVVIDRLVNGPTIRTRLGEAVDLALKLGEGTLIISQEEDNAAEAAPPKAGKKSKRGTGVQVGDMVVSADYACNHCGLSFQPPSPQLFSFNSPRGMCLECDGLGTMFSFDPIKLVTDPTKSLSHGCIELVGPWKDLGRWKRHIYKGVAETMERKLELAEGTLTDTPWQELDEEFRYLWLWGTGDEHITFTWRAGKNSQKYGGTFEGLIPELLEKYRGAKSKTLIAKLEEYMNVIGCPDCLGERLNPQARAVTLSTASSKFSDESQKTLPAVSALPIDEAKEFFSELVLDETQQKIASEVLKEIRGRLGFLTNVGLDYLSLGRTAPTLSGGETQRIRLAGQIGCGLVGVLYILDEPSIGLHPRDNERLLSTLEQLRDQGNTVVVVEHDEDTMRAADLVVDFGPGAGVRGGELMAVGTAEQVAKERKSITGAYLAGRRKIEIPEKRRIESLGDSKLVIHGARHNNLKNVTMEIPLGAFVCVTGASGSGKSSLVSDILVEALRRDLNGGNGEPGEHDRIEGLEKLDKMIAIDQSPIGRTPRSNPATYIKVFDEIRKLYTQLPEAKRRGYKPGRFSFNVTGGRCEACSGNGSNKLEMDFLADVWITCNVCQGHRFNHESLQIRYKEKSIADVLEMDVQQALEHFENIPQIRHKLETLHSVGLDYLKLGQPSPTLSGGEAQRIKLARELVKKSTGRTLYLLDEPTTGLHFADIEMLLKVLHEFVDAGNTVLVVEHNLDVVKTADWVIDVGPDGGKHGGEIIATGTPEQIIKMAEAASAARNGEAFRFHTATALAPYLNGKPHSTTKPAKRESVKQATHITVEGASEHNLRDVSVKIPRDEFTVFCGPSGSGKSSLAMDTIYAEGQRRYVESLSSYARQFVGQLQKPRVESIEGLSPAIAIEQRTTGHSPRSTVGTVTEIYDYFRILMSRLGQMHCPECDIPVGTQSVDEVIDTILAEPEGTKLYLMAPVELAAGQTYADLWQSLRASGYLRVRIDDKTFELESAPEVDRRRKHKVEVIADRVTIRNDSRSRLAESVESALSLGRGVMVTVVVEEDIPEARWRTKVHSQHRSCGKCGRSFEALSPHHFSFNNTLGWCGACEGLGTEIGANPAALLRSTQLTLAEGAILAWPGIKQPLFAAMLAALSKHTGLPTDVPFEQLSPRHRRIVLYGTGDEWIRVDASSEARGASSGKKKPSATRQAPSNFLFQYKGLYPALEEASRMSPRLRSQLDHLVDEIECSQCGGSRLRDDASAVRFQGRTVGEYCRLPLGRLLPEIEAWKLSARELKVAGELVREISNRLTFLLEVGLEYLSIGRSAPTLSGGESQRIRLASQVGSGLCGVLYVLDEPTIGLHPRDNARLISALHKLRDLGNTLLVVEHDRDVVESADQLLDFGPAAGRLGGEVVARGTPAEVAKRRGSVTGPYLSGKKAIPVPTNRRMGEDNGPLKQPRPKMKKSADAASAARSADSSSTLRILGARHNNLKNIDVDIPLGTLTAVTGVSGSGKSSLVEDVLYNQLAKTLHRAGTNPGGHDRIVGIQNIDKVIRVDQKALGNSPSSNPATYTGVFELIRNLFAQLPEAKLRGYSARRFSFNVPGGRCDACEGAGQRCIEMHFLPDVWVDCELCHGERFNPETLDVQYRGRSIADVLAMSCGEALELFENIPKIRRILQTLCDVGLDYVALGQSAATLSGGEAQRVKLAAELSRPDTGRTLYILDEPTTGLHFDDIAKLLDVLHRLVDLGNTVLVIEHNLDVIKQADWIIDIGPEAGAEGGQVVSTGTPEDIILSAEASSAARKKSTPISHTAAALAPILAAGPHKKRKPFDFNQLTENREGDVEINDLGGEIKMPWEVDGRRWHTRDRVSRSGSPCHWDGKILDHVERRIQELGDFAPTNWNTRTIVEIATAKKTDGWFFHAITGEPWLLKMKFRTAKKTFQRDQLAVALDLKPLNDIPEIESYGRTSRVKCKNLRAPFQEVEIRAYSWEEIDTPEFWKFLEQAVAGFRKFTDRTPQDPEDVMPWKVLGRKWHLARKGFPPGKKPAWNNEVLEELLELLGEVASEAAGEDNPSQPQFLWNNQQVVNVMVSQQRQPWATVYTKQLAGIDLVLNGPSGVFDTKRIADLAANRAIKTSEDELDQVKLRFIMGEDLLNGDLPDFLIEHLAAVGGAAERIAAS